MRAGADDFLAKPLQPFELEARLLAAQRVTKLHQELSRMRRELTLQANTDALTGLRNRQGMVGELEQLHVTSVRYDRSFAVALFDVDFFKRYNDRYGHLAGDAALRSVASVLGANVRDVDQVYRFGGEEFLIVLPEQTAPAAQFAVERIQSALRALSIEHLDGGPTETLTLSVGIATSTPSQRLRPERLLIAADAALYRAKDLGRDQLQLALDAEPTAV